MKQIITFFLLIIFLTNGYGQRIVKPDKQWEGTKLEYPQSNFNSKFRTAAKIINGKQYFELMYKVEGGWFEGVMQYYREDDNKVYRLFEGEERVIYDFTLIVGDTIMIRDDNDKHYKFFPVRTVDTTILNKVLRKLEMRVIPENSQSISSEKHVWIEGVGDIAFFFGNGAVFNNQKASLINCVKESSFFYSAASHCTGIVLTANEEKTIEPKFLYNNVTKKLILNNNDVQQVHLYNISGVKVASFAISETIKELDLSAINLQLCVVVCHSKNTYSSKIISL